MDYVPRDTRARWKALDSISVFGWCGSAAVGGIIADSYDYSTTFLVTAALQALGTLLFALLFFIIPRSVDVETAAADAANAVAPVVEPIILPGSDAAAGGGAAQSVATVIGMGPDAVAPSTGSIQAPPPTNAEHS